MARRTSRASAKSSRSAKTKSRKPAASSTASVEVVEEGGGETPEAGIAIVTTIALFIAILLVDALNGRFDAGMFF